MTSQIKVLSKIPLEFGESFISLNPKTNQSFISENLTNSISLINFSSKTKLKLIELKRPRDILFEHNSNKIYAIYDKMGFFSSDLGKKLCVIDVNSKKILKDFENKNGFGGMARNSKTKKIYVTEPKKRKVWIIDEESMEVERQIDVKEKYKQIIVNENNNDLILSTFVGSRDKFVIGRYNFDSNLTEDIFKQRQWTSREESSVKFYPKINKIFAFLSDSTDDMDGWDSRIHIIDYDNPETEPRISSKHRIYHDFDMDPSNEFIYFIQNTHISWKESQTQLIKKNLSTNSEESFDIDFPYLGLSITPSIFRIHPYTGNILIHGGKAKDGGLFEVSIT